MIDIRSTVTQSEYLEAQQLFMREQKRKQLWWVRALWVALALCSVVALVSTPAPLSFPKVAPLAVLTIVLCLLPLCVGSAQRAVFRKRFWKEKKNFTDAHVTIDGNGYSCEVPGVGSGIAEWSGMSQWLEGKLVFVLCSGLLMRIVPKASLTGVQVEELRSLLTQQIGPVGVSRE